MRPQRAMTRVGRSRVDKTRKTGCGGERQDEASDDEPR